MSGSTAMDVEVARQLLSSPPGYRGKSHVERIAAALADERAKARAPFLALADEEDKFCEEMQQAEIRVAVPMKAGREVLDRIFDAVADAAYEAQPEDREDWDVFVSASMPETPQVPTHLLRDAAQDPT